jgi:hypothetical protein
MNRPYLEHREESIWKLFIACWDLVGLLWSTMALWTKFGTYVGFESNQSTKNNNNIVYIHHNTGKFRGSVLVGYNAECADEEKVSKIGSSNRFQVTGL